METKKIISSFIARLKIAYPYYFKELTDEEFVGLLNMYQEELLGYNEITLSTALKSIIRKYKFMPSLKEVLDECEACRSHRQNIIIDKMIKAGYFKDPREIDKTYHFLEEGIVPDWLLADMRKYGYDDDKLLTAGEIKLLEGNNA